MKSLEPICIFCIFSAATLGMAKASEPQQKSNAKVTAGQAVHALEFRQVASLPTRDKDAFKYAAVAVDFDQEAVVSRNYLISKGEDVRDRIGAYLWSLDPLDPRRTRLPDSTTFGFVPDSTLAYQVHWGPGVRFWDTRTHTVSGDYIPHELREDTTIGPALSPGGKLMVTRSQLNHLQFWDIEKREPITTEIKQAGVVYRMAFSSDGKWFFSQTGRSLNIWEPETGNLVAEGLRHDISSDVYSPATGRVATFENHDEEENVRRSELVIRSGKAFSETGRIRLAGRASQASWIDDTHLVVIGDEGPFARGRNLVYLVSLASDPPEARTLTRDDWIRNVAVAPDRRHFIVRARDETSCWKIGEQKPIWTKPGDPLVSFGDEDWVLLHNGPLTAHWLADGKELWRNENVEMFRASGASIWTCNENQMEIWRVERDGERGR